MKKLDKTCTIPKEIKNFVREIDGGYWNTRIIKHILKTKLGKKTIKETYYAIHEVYYNGKDEIWGWSEEPINLSFEDKQDFGEILRQMVEASEKPILQLKGDSLIETKELWTIKEK